MSEFIAQQGWQCPICKRVYSPFTFMCYYCGGDTVTTTGTGTATPYNLQDEGFTTNRMGTFSDIDWKKQQTVTTTNNSQSVTFNPNDKVKDEDE